MSATAERQDRASTPPNRRPTGTPAEVPPAWDARLRLLLVEDNPGDATLVRLALSNSAIRTAELDWAGTLGEARKRLGSANYDALLLDLGLPDATGLDGLDRIHSDFPSIPVIVLTGLEDQESAIAALRQGAQDYLVKGRVEPENLARAIRHAIERARLHTALERQNQDLDEFAYIVSHDLKAPLRAIRHLADWIEEDLRGSASSETAENLHLLRSRVERLERIITAILDYARAGRVAGAAEPVDPAQVVRDVVDLLQPAPGFRIVVESAMPTVATERVLLHQVLQNLIGNAVKHHDRAEGTVRVAAGDLGTFVAFSVEDDGPGIPAEHHDRLFKLFQTLKVQDDSGSTGVGLALVKKIVERQGGTVTLESGPGRGSRFRFTWPKNPP